MDSQGHSQGQVLPPWAVPRAETEGAAAGP